MCNCSGSNKNCNNCQSGQPCNCPPNYYVQPQATGCLCCPPGYTAQTIKGVTLCYPTNGPANQQGIPQVQCNPCDQVVSTNCVTYQAAQGYPINNAVFGIEDGDTLTTIINKIYTGIMGFLESSQFCALVQNCPLPGGGTTPIVTGILITFP